MELKNIFLEIKNDIQLIFDEFKLDTYSSIVTIYNNKIYVDVLKREDKYHCYLNETITIYFRENENELKTYEDILRELRRKCFEILASSRMKKIIEEKNKYLNEQIIKNEVAIKASFDIQAKWENYKNNGYDANLAIEWNNGSIEKKEI